MQVKRIVVVLVSSPDGNITPLQDISDCPSLSDLPRQYILATGHVL
jgi:hypothetical protein